VKGFALSIFFCLSLNALASGQQRKIVFERRDNVWVANLDGTAAKKIANGSWPDISPDGTRLAFNTNENEIFRPGRPPAPPIRHIAVADLATGNLTILKEIPSDNCFGPVWSPDGSKLAFQIMTGEQWRLGIINADASGFHLIKDASVKDDPLYELGTFWAPAWARDGKSIFCHDFHNLYQIDLDGNVKEKWELSKPRSDENPSSNSRLSVSPEGRTLLVTLNVKDTGRGLWVHQRGVFTFDLETSIMTRVSGEADSVSDAYWVTKDEFLCVTEKANEKESSLYRMSIYGKRRKLPVKHARWPSVSGP
jgi:TolB protein